MVLGRINVKFALAALAVAVCVLAIAPTSTVANASTTKADSGNIAVPVNRSTLVVLPNPMSEVLVANPDIADVHAHNATNLTVVGKRLGRTNVRIFDKGGKMLRQFDVTVTYDLPTIRMALKNFLPDEAIGVEMVSASIALTGRVTSAASADKAIKIVHDFIRAEMPKDMAQESNNAGGGGSGKSAGLEADPNILNMMQIVSGQQVQLRVRVGEIDRSALKTLGVDLSGAVANSFQFATGANALAGLLPPAGGGPGTFLFPVDANNIPINTQGIAAGRVTSSSVTLAGALHALEQDGLFRLLAEPNLVAVSGEQAEFLAGGEIPIPVPQSGTGGGGTVTIEYKPYGVAVRFKPVVLSENRIRMEVQPEVSELDPSNAVRVSSFLIPALTTRRANTTIELAPGESFMIAGLLKDRSQATIDQLPGVKEMPVLGALFRSTQFQRNETELVIAVTPYIVDPLKGSDVKLPTDNFRPSSQMELFFFGALGALASDHSQNVIQTPVEGPIGFMVD